MELKSVKMRNKLFISSCLKPTLFFWLSFLKSIFPCLRSWPCTCVEHKQPQERTARKQHEKGEQGDRRVGIIIGIKKKESGCAHITGQPLIVLHQLLILLVDSQHLADPVGCCLCLDDDDDEGRNSVRPRAQSKPDGVTVDVYLALQWYNFSGRT